MRKSHIPLLADHVAPKQDMLPLQLMPHGNAMEDAAAQAALEAELLQEPEPAVIAGIIPVPPSVTPAMRAALERAMTLKYGDDVESLDAWIHAPHPNLTGMSPFQRLVDGDGLAVLRALLGLHQAGARAERSATSRSKSNGGLRLVG